MPYFELSKDEIAFPPAYFADIDGLVAVGGDLSIERLLLAYNNGIFFWNFPLKHIKWWSPDPRIVLKINSFEFPSNRFKDLQKNFSLSINTAFEQTIACCKQQYNIKDKMDNSWVTERMARRFNEMRALGFAHSIEVWKNNSLVGGIIGIALGKIFFGEYLFSTTKDADELAILHLINTLKEKEFDLIDFQKETMFFEDLEYDEMSRMEYIGICKDNFENHPHKITNF